MFRFFIATTFSLSTILLFAQQSKQLDSLLMIVKTSKQDSSYIKNLITISKNYIQISNYKEAKKITHLILNKSQLLQYKKGVVASYYYYGELHKFESNYDSALVLLNKAYLLSDSIQDIRQMVQALESISATYIDKGDYKAALLYALKALKINEKINNKKGIAICFNSIGNIYLEQKNNQKSLENYLKALKILEEIGDSKSAAMLYNNIGNIFSRENNYQKALFYYAKLLTACKNTDYKVGIAAALNNIGTVYYRQKKYSQAMDNFQEALIVRNEINDKRGVGDCYLNIGLTYMRLNDSYNSEKYTKTALKIATEIGHQINISNSYTNLSELFEKTGDYKQALYYQRLYKAINDTIFNTERNKQITEMAVKYNTEKNEKELEIRKSKISEQDNVIKQSRANAKLLSLSLVFLLIVFALSFYFYRTFQAAKRKEIELSTQKIATKTVVEALENERTRIAQDLHDGVAQTLASVILKIRSLLPIEQTQFLHSEEKISSILTIMLDTHKEIRSISHQMMPRGLSDGDFSTSISELLHNMFSNTNIYYKFETHGTTNLLNSEAIKICLYRVLQELSGNIIKHAKATNVFVQLLQSDAQIILLVEDDGIGTNLKSTTLTNGIGMQNIKARVLLVGGIFSFEPGPYKGMVANIRIPLIHNKA